MNELAVNKKIAGIKKLLNSLPINELEFFAKTYRSKRYKNKKFQKTDKLIDSIYSVMASKHEDIEQAIHLHVKEARLKTSSNNKFINNLKLIDKEISKVENSSKRERTSVFHENNKAKFVYLIVEQLYGAIKIGSTKKLDQRIMQFGVKLPFDIKIIHILYSENGGDTEKLLHMHFKKKRLNGEWFSLNQEDISNIKNLKLPKHILQSINGRYYQND
ncbi:GIY-YIG nuclease family protein [Aneurinibacillus migulanus]|uniref:GIY-YIG nuclease family protein n=1 Tax=Aneurinibacillus migulanus TaxID=47500 RepID=UPI0006968C57|nr:GIY-YIG nuclease family protein [Aneurinibacillus migulanus]